LENTEERWKNRYEYLALKNIPDWQKSCWWDQGTIAVQQEFIFKRAKELSRQKMKIADIGCGPGYYCRLLSAMGHEVVGIDYSLNTLLLSKGRNQDKSVRLSQADANYLPLKSGTFDLVLGMGILLSAEYPEKLMGELHRILKPNGKILITTLVQQGLWELPFYPLYCLWNCDGFPSTDSFPLKLIKRQQTLCPRPVDDPEIIMKRYTVKTVKKFLKDLGFDGIKLRFQGRFPLFPHLLNSFILNASATKK